MRSGVLFSCCLAVTVQGAQFGTAPTTGLSRLRANPIVVIGDSLSCDGTDPFFTPTNYANVASGVGHDWPSQLLTLTNYIMRGPYMNLASNNACLVDWIGNGGAVTGYVNRGVQAFVRANSNAVPYVFVLLGANCLTDGTGFQNTTNQFGALYSMIRGDGGHVVAIANWVNNTMTFGQLTNWTNVTAWQRTNSALYHEFVDSWNVITNIGVQSIDGTHLNPANNLLLANYIAGRIFPNQNALYASFSRIYDHLEPRSIRSQYGEFEGLEVTGFRTGGRTAGITFTTDGSTFGEMGVHNDPGAAYLANLLLASTTALQLRANQIQFVGGGYNPAGTSAGFFFGTTNAPNFAAPSGSIYCSSNAIMYIKSNVTWVKVTTQ